MKPNLTRWRLMGMPLFQTRFGKRNKRKIVTWDCQRYGDVPLASLPLTPSERKVVSDLGVENMSDLVMFPAGQFQEFADFTNTEFEKFKDCLAKGALAKLGVGGSPKTFSPKSIKKLPFFARSSERAFLPESLHQSFEPDVDVDQLYLSIRGRRVLEKLGIRTIGQLLLTHASQFMAQPTIGERTVGQVRKAVFGYLLHANNLAKPPPINYQSFAGMIESFLRLAIPRKQYRKIIVMRLGWDTGRTSTLESVGKRFGLSRERVRQIVKMSLAQMHSPRKVMFLDRFWQAAADAHGENGGEIAAVGRALARRFRWRRIPPEHVLKQVLDLLLELNPARKTSPYVATAPPEKAHRGRVASGSSKSILDLRKWIAAREARLRQLLAQRNRLVRQLAAMDRKISILTGKPVRLSQV